MQRSRRAGLQLLRSILLNERQKLLFKFFLVKLTNFCPSIFWSSCWGMMIERSSSDQIRPLSSVEARSQRLRWRELNSSAAAASPKAATVLTLAQLVPRPPQVEEGKENARNSVDQSGPAKMIQFPKDALAMAYKPPNTAPSTIRTKSALKKSSNTGRRVVFSQVLRL